MAADHLPEEQVNKKRRKTTKERKIMVLSRSMSTVGITSYVD